MASTDAELRRYYAARAREYEAIYAKPERQADLRRLEALLPPLFADRRVLEIACGTGYWTQFLAPVAQHIVAVDANRETLDIAAAKLLTAERAELRIADAYALPDELGTFDAAFAGFWWSHIPVRERTRFYATLHRRLEAGAKIVFLDNRYIAGSSTPISHRDDDGNAYQRRMLADGSAHVVLKNFPTEPELVADVAHCARNARYIALEYYWLFSYELAPAAV